MLSVIIVTGETEHPVVATLSTLVSGATAGLIREVTLVDLSASDAMVRVADVAGCQYLALRGSHAEALAAGAAHARSPWLMVVPAGGMLDPSWVDETVQFVQSVGLSGRPRAGFFPRGGAPYARPSVRERLRPLLGLVGWLPADAGLLIARDHLKAVGGFNLRARHPEAALLRRLNRSSRMRLRSRVVMI